MIREFINIAGGYMNIKEALTFDDVLLVPVESNVLPKDVDVSTYISSSIKLNIPIVSAAMDTVTESRTAIVMAQEGGMGIIHRNMSIEDEVNEVGKVKKFESGIIFDPITMHPDQKLYDAVMAMRKYRISGLPVVKEGKLVGIITNRDLRFEKNLDQKVSDVMTKDNLVKAEVGITLDEAKEILHKNKVEKLLVVDGKDNLKGLITIKDIEKTTQHPSACKDSFGRLRVGAAVGVTGDMEERVDRLLKAGADLIVVDTAHAHSKRVIECVENIRNNFNKCELVAGNVATKEGAERLIKAGVDGIKVGIGPGSICTTRIVAGVGVPQLSAIMECRKVAESYDIPIIADGGIKNSGDIVKAIAAGAHTVMIGNLFAGTDESPGEIVLYQGRSYKTYRGMGSLEAMKSGSKDRYCQDMEDDAKLVPEGIEGRVPYRGPLSDSIYQLVGGLKAGMGYVGAKNIEELREKAKFIRITPSGYQESHVHNVFITKEAPNYWIG